ncbi:double-stranded DNA binding protein [Arabidopsis thaliana]|uniref:Double-stranded DNA binding protein n=1 Tax=Arabidopsis thaliana TaxID=3702 RepID=A0A1P8BCF0_ARATH|nr:double-stranded DNA binding protein [Arabidopsis thaliana]NP_001330966.1 double-stranded DNA binding protein [Arabidopsis thaliana]NP_001330968.1 double-stranded DNA binding protein [Arabidopsis thaliana]ANM69272.1 double-stranded DNA binding protein [Arabidopsis thaliana]ANM69274.1 double-stranded DNA binding protein [Arabidopsis thaliana]ANM69276.1 double-stranded DNA binding protein [Arabidopsis thaliana]|eukprot:NP_001330964.1 double-stranded DNA binding protein [Arabidopsis thaliana]
MSSSSREGSPDWLRSYEAPMTTSLLSLSSSDDDSPYRESEVISSLPLPDDDGDDIVVLETESVELLTRKNSETKVVTKQVSIEQVFSRKKKADASLNLEGKENGNNVDCEKLSSKHKDAQGGADSVWLVSSDSEPSSPIKQEVTVSTEKDADFVLEATEEEPAVKTVRKEKSPKTKSKSSRKTPKEGNSAQEILKTEDKDKDTDTDTIIAEEVTTDQKIKPSSGSSSRLPLVLSEKVNRTKVLVECEGDSIDLSGDMGAVGRVVVSDTTGDMYLDLKGTIYKSTIIPSRTFCVVNVGQTEAKIEAIMNDFIQLIPQSNVYEAETMVEGTLEGFTFESDDESNKNAKTAVKPADQSVGTEEETNTKAKPKAKAKGETVIGKKRGRPSKEKQPPAKKARNSAPKKPKAKK